jgi:hypothetical protein
MIVLLNERAQRDRLDMRPRKHALVVSPVGPGDSIAWLVEILRGMLTGMSCQLIIVLMGALKHLRQFCRWNGRSPQASLDR